MGNFDDFHKVFNDTSNQLKQNEKSYIRTRLLSLKDNETLNDDFFGDLIFHEVGLHGVNKIKNKAFGKTAQYVNSFSCLGCSLTDSPPNYNIWSTLNQMTQLTFLYIELNINEIPTNAIKPIDGLDSTIDYMNLISKQNLTIKSNAFINMPELYKLTIQNTMINSIESAAFNFSGQMGNKMEIVFENVNISGDAFHKNTFNCTIRQIVFTFESTNLNYLNQSSWSSLLDNGSSGIIFHNSLIDCNDCRNLWLNKKIKQMTNPYCQGNTTSTLFDDEIQLKLKSKCK